MKRLIKFFGLIVIFLVLLVLFLVKPNNNTPLEQTDYYPQTMNALNASKLNGGYGSGLKCGWAKENITPNFAVQIAGYGLRKEPAKAIHDSIYARSIVFDNGKQKVAMITMDLLIVPPLVVKKVMPILNSMGFSRAQIYFGATHTHSSAGGWAEGLGGRGLAGPLSEKMIQKIADGIINGVIKAQNDASYCKIGFQEINAATLVSNRLFGENAPEDPWIRIVRIEKDKNQAATLLTYTAHPTCISKADNRITCDYPGMLVKNLEQSGMCQFAAFFAGAVGSMKPADNGLHGYEQAETLANKLTEMIVQQAGQMNTDTSSWISTSYLPVAMRDPQLRINNYLCVRPWLFNKLMGKQEIGFSELRIGNIIWIGAPCDYSGEMVNSSDSIATKNHKNLLITSFNGGYVGYITPDKYYDSVKYETREMNWFGPYNGRYFKEIVSGLVKKAVR